MNNYNIVTERINVGGGIKSDLSKFCDESATEDIKVETLTKIAKSIWKKIIEYNLKTKITSETEIDLLGQLQIEYNDFFLSFPLILRWMVQMRQFKVKIFEAYIRKFINTEIASKIDFLKLQGEYIIMLYKSLNPSLKASEIEKYEEDIINLLIAEDDSFKEIEEEAKQEIKKEEARLNKERREALYNSILKKKLAASI